MIATFFKKFVLNALLYTYWCLLCLQQYVATTLVDYNHELWIWGIHRDWERVLQLQLKRTTKSHNRAMGLWKVVNKTVRRNYSPFRKTISYHPLNVSASTQRLDITRKWYPLFFSPSCDLFFRPKNQVVNITISASYSTKNQTYMWGLLNVRTGHILGRIKLEPGVQNRTTVSFLIENMSLRVPCKLRFMQCIARPGIVHVHLMNNIEIIMSYPLKKMKKQRYESKVVR